MMCQFLILLRILESVEGFVGVAYEWQAHLSILFGSILSSLSAMDGTCVLLRNFVNREVADINIRGQLRLERCSNFTELIPYHSSEERMTLDLRGTIMSTTFFAESIIGITQEADMSVSERSDE